jgi:hypothetical protein
MSDLLNEVTEMTTEIVDSPITDVVEAAPEKVRALTKGDVAWIATGVFAAGTAVVAGAKAVGKFVGKKLNERKVKKAKAILAKAEAETEAKTIEVINEPEEVVDQKKSK